MTSEHVCFLKPSQFFDTVPWLQTTDRAPLLPFCSRHIHVYIHCADVEAGYAAIDGTFPTLTVPFLSSLSSSLSFFFYLDQISLISFDLGKIT